MAGARTRLLLDVSPVTARVESRTGLARVALSLALSLANRSDISMESCAWGSLLASHEFEDVRREFPSLHGVIGAGSRWQTYCVEHLRQAATQAPLERAAWRLAGQITNRLRNPLAGVALGDYDIAHSTYARPPRSIRRARLPFVLTIHDVMPLRLPRTSLPPGQVGITRRILQSIRPHDWVACVSNWTRNEFLNVTRHDPNRTIVIPNAVDHELFHPRVNDAEKMRLRQRLGITNCPFLFTLSSLAPHKNLRFLIDCWRRSEAADTGAHLVIAGGRTNDSAELCRMLGLADPVRGVLAPGFLNDQDVRTLAATCQAFLFPSCYEGFGLPALEAMACGAPVIASNSTSLPEVVGSAGRLLPASDADAWTSAIRESVAEPIRFLPCRTSIARAAGFSWDDTAAAYADLYRKMIT